MSSFKKKTSKVTVSLPGGTKLSSYQSSLLLTSYGMNSLDSLLGGGIPIGTITLLLSDRYTDYSNIALSYFLSSGIILNHKICLISFDHEPQAIVNKLPGVYELPIVKEKVVKKEAKEDLTIAWRYKDLPNLKQKSEEDQDKDIKYCPTLDLTTHLNKEAIEKNVPILIDATNDDIDFAAIFSKIEELISNEFSSKIEGIPLSSRRILRIAIYLIGSPLGCITKFEDIYRFIYMVKGLLRYSFSVMMLSFPPYLFEEDQILAIQSICDTALEFKSFADRENKKASNEEYQGLFFIHKFPRLNSFTSLGLKFQQKSENNLGFKLKRKKLLIETYHLPIEGGVSERRVEPKDNDKDQAGPRRITSNKAPPPSKKDPLEF
ncbi:PAXNEB-domain-containing protein [Neoconidiobolus thromboides FSU 785]|nr:PAXNEB-domain-containing protein [Neoconidiobolus thromboides FSU 785]